MRARLVLLTALAMVAFAGNSILCRLALKGTATDPASFTVVRILTGAVVLALLVRLRGREHPWLGGSWAGAAALSLYAVAFSFAYVRLSAGSGALLLFGAVQSSLLGYGLCKGERLSALALCGFATSIAGLLLLLLPGSTAPHPGSALVMLCAGAAWAWYTVLGRGGADALHTTGRQLPARRAYRHRGRCSVSAGAAHRRRRRAVRGDVRRARVGHRLYDLVPVRAAPECTACLGRAVERPGAQRRCWRPLARRAADAASRRGVGRGTRRHCAGAGSARALALKDYASTGTRTHPSISTRALRLMLARVTVHSPLTS